MLLAGTRQQVKSADDYHAKPAVFGAKYRIIDFTLSNCTNSNIDTVGIDPISTASLNEYIGNGSPWIWTEPSAACTFCRRIRPKTVPIGIKAQPMRFTKIYISSNVTIPNMF